ncbi:LIMK1 [Lepeophtheirus salmonis]|uniref:LIMK1 n=1 Tax=Lepeophtheirus salmonis TaxID=72036 RepID=A0A7R8CUB9_LEPSM|nr:LIMK1 [Lepeophtheirus salmonis]CAF2932078.1 LIMK1 [Lepeophtheirus salmonis]
MPDFPFVRTYKNILLIILEERRRRRGERRMKCGDCGEEIDGSYYEHEGRSICKKDYQKYRKRCGTCDDFITGVYYTQDTGLICANCYKVRPTCSFYTWGTSCNSCDPEMKSWIATSIQHARIVKIELMISNLLTMPFDAGSEASLLVFKAYQSE